MFTRIRQLLNAESLNYRKRFEKALKRSKSWGLTPPFFKPCKMRYASSQNLATFQQVVSQYLSPLRAQDVSQQCFAVTAALKEPLEQALGIPLAFTLGYVKYNDRNVFYSSPMELKSLLREGMHSPVLNLHAWLTLPSHEIIDMTFGTTYGVVNELPDVIGRMAFIHADDMTADMQYHPQLIGEEYLIKIGCLSVVY